MPKKKTQGSKPKATKSKKQTSTKKDQNTQKQLDLNATKGKNAKNDTAQQVAIIIAVLLIPAAILAYSYATQPAKETSNLTDLKEAYVDELAPETVESDTTDEETAQEATNDENLDNEQEENAESDKESAIENSKEETAGTTENNENTDKEETKKNIILLVLGGLINKFANSLQDNAQQAQQNVNNSQDQAEEETKMTEEENQDTADKEVAPETKQEKQESSNATSVEESTENAIDQLNTLPNTSSKTLYTVQKGDSIYKISLKVCGNESFYKKHIYTNYLKVGQVINVECD